MIDNLLKSAIFVLFPCAVSLLIFFGVIEGAPPLNVLFIAVDDLRASITPYGGPIKTPNLERLAQSGTVFLRAYCQYAVCSPSRSSLLSGLRPDQIQVFDLVMHFRTTRPDVVTLPEYFKAHGYHTQSLGKIYHGTLDDPQSWSEPAWFPPSTKGSSESEDGTRVKWSKRTRALPFSAPDVTDASLPDGMVATEAVDVLSGLAAKQKHDEQPFFLAVGFRKPHMPFEAPAKYWDMYEASEIKLPTNTETTNVPAVALHPGGEILHYPGIPKEGPIPDETARKLIHGYYAASSYVDAQIGRVLQALDDLELADNTIVVVWSDHGWSLGEHGLWSKYTNFEEATKAPLIVRVPGQRAEGGRTNALVEFIDIYPTLVSAAGLPMPEGLDGESLLPLTDDPLATVKDAAISQYLRRGVMGYSLRTDRYRYTHWGNKGDELYDHVADPGENINLANFSEYAIQVDSLKAQLRTLVPDLDAQKKRKGETDAQ